MWSLHHKLSPRVGIAALLFALATVAASPSNRSVEVRDGNEMEVSGADGSIHRQLRGGGGGGGLIDPKTVDLREQQPVTEITAATTANINANADTVVLLTVTGGFFNMWLNWLTFFERLAIPNLPVLLFPEDEQAHQKCMQQVKDQEAAVMAAGNTGEMQYRADLTCLPWNFAFSDDKIEDDVGALGYRDEGYKKMMAHRPAIIQRELEAGRNVLFSDVDVVWKKNPLPYLQEQLQQSSAVDGVEPHILGQADGKWLCPGFMFYRACPETIALVNKWRQALEGQVQSNQGPFNSLLDQAAAGKLGISIKAEALPGNLYANGIVYFKEMKPKDRKSVVVIHNNFIVGYDRKVQRMKTFGLWQVKS